MYKEGRMTEEQNVNVTMRIQKTKSIAPYIMGLLGFLLNIPNVICTMICAGASKALAENPTLMLSGGGMAGEEYQSATENASSTADGFTAMLIIIIICWIGCFIFSFFGRSKISKVTGILVMLGGIALAAMSIPNFSVLGFCSGICYAIAGITSMANSKRPL
jgi:hypothetical protein